MLACVVAVVVWVVDGEVEDVVVLVVKNEQPVNSIANDKAAMIDKTSRAYFLDFTADRYLLSCVRGCWYNTWEAVQQDRRP